MSLGLKRDKRFHQGIYKPSNIDKFIGREAIFRSGLELRAFRFFDSNPNVLKWGSECIQVPYFDPIACKNRVYHVDNFVMIKEGDVIKKYLVEIKPYKQTIPPKVTKRRKKEHLIYEQAQYLTNSEGKWKAAKKFAKKNGMEFIIITEKELG